ncbi:hypothetical protein BGX23_011911 [Mortierella sp. AD031]|nr:hypothetical protein BGX23_011911 [Mortierella sp. AD031]
MVAQTPEPAFPSVQELSLTLSADIEIHRLWKTITEILSQRFHATRITLCLPQDPTAVSSSIENNLHQSRPWGLKAHWDYKYHFLDENTVTPKDEFAHHHHRLQQKSVTPSSSQDSPAHHQSHRISLSSLPLPSSSSSSSSFSSSPSSSSTSSSFSRRRAQANSNRNHNNNIHTISTTSSYSSNSFSIHLSTNSHHIYNDTSTNNDHDLARPYDDISSSRKSNYHNSATTSANNKPNGRSSNNNNNNNDSSSSPSRHGHLDFTTHDPSTVDYIPDSKDYHGDYWSIHAPLDGGYSSSASTTSSYSSSSSPAIKPSRSSHLRGYSIHSNGTECFSNLQSLEYDPEPLLNEHTIDSILRAGKTVVLTREYVGSKANRRRIHKARPFLSDDDDSSYTDTETTDRRMNGIEIEVGGNVKALGVRTTPANSGFENDAGSDMDSSSSRYDSEGSYFPPVESAISGAFSNASNFVAAQSKAGYTDFVQGLNPTWSQSPAPSPNIIKEDPTINPFFFQPLTSYPAMDDDTFDPPDPLSESTEDDNCSPSDHKDSQGRLRTSSRPQSSTGEPHGIPSLPPLPPPLPSVMANARSLIHVPLYRSTDHNNQRFLPSDIRHHRPPAMPVAIVSFLSDQIPYPPEALDIFTELNPFLANQITNALRLEDMVARSKRWGDLSTSGMSEGSRTNETFTDSIRRKLKDTNDMPPSDLATPKADYPPVNGKSAYTRSKPPPAYGQQTSTDPGGQPSTVREDPQSTPTMPAPPTPTVPPKRPALRRDKNEGDLSVRLDRKETSTINSRPNPREADDGESPTRFFGAESDTSVVSTPTPFNPFMLQSPDPERFSEGDSVSEVKQPESFYNLDSTTDEIHRSLNLLNLDVTGSATCPLAPQTKRMLGKHHQGTKNTQSHHIDGAVLSNWTNGHRRTESSPNPPDMEESDGPDGMWQTLQTEESDKKPVSLPNPRTSENEHGMTGQESPYFSSIHSLSPSGTSKRHLFSTSKRSGVRRRHKSVKEHAKIYQSQAPLTESPVPSSPYIPNMPGFASHQFEAAQDHPGFSQPAVFSPEPSPIASPTAHYPRTFDRDDTGHSEAGSLTSQWRAPSREELEKERAPLSRHGSGWSFNSDDTSLASPGLHHERHTTGRKQKRRHHGFSDKGGHAQIPRTRLLRMIVDAIAHHVFTLSPQTGCVTWLNQRCMQYTGIPLPHLLHKPWTGVLHKDDELKFQPLFKESFEKGEMFNAQYRVRRFDGQYRWFLGRVVPVRDCGGHIVQWFGTSTDIHDQKIAELQLNRQVELELNEKKYRLLAEAIPQIVFTAAPQVGLTYANAKWFTYSGQVFEQAAGLGFMDHVHPDDRSKCFLPTNISEDNSNTSSLADQNPEYKQSTSPGTEFGQGPGEVSYQTEMRLLRKDGKYRWFLVKCISVEVVEQGRKWFGTCTDINDQKLLEHKLKEAHDAAQKSTESKTRFLSNMSHEIRTPLVGITGMINFLITTELTSEQLDYVHTVQQSADALLLVINDILDLSKVEAGMMKLEMEPFSVHAMTEGANELLSTLAIQKGLELGFLVEDEVPEVVIGDRVRLRQVLINIIGNAIKFTSQGEVFSRCSLVPAKPNADPDVLTIKFEISDTGKGFDDSERAVMFKPFSQVDTSSTRKHGGTGLGLVLSKEFVELHGGKIACESVKGEGSKFSFTFVARVPPPNVTARATTPIASEDIRVNGLMQNFNKTAYNTSRLPWGSGSGAGSGAGSFADKPPLMKDFKRPSDPALLKHVTGLKLIPGEMCFAEPDFESTKKTATKALEVATKKIKRGEFLTADSTLAMDEEEKERSVQGPTMAITTTTTATTESPPGDVATAMTRTESILDDRRYLKVGQLTPSNPPMGEPPSVAVIAARLPNPAVDMKLAIPAKVLESKALVAENRKATAALANATRPDLLSHSESSSSSSSSSCSAGSSIESKLLTSTANSSVGSLTNVTGATGSVAVSSIPEQARILVVADLLHARETILHLIKQLVPKKLSPLIDVATDLKEGIEFLVGGRKMVTKSGKYNYLVINLASYMSVMDIFSAMQQEGVLVEPNVVTCVITTPIQRAAVMETVKVEEASMEVVKSSLEASTPKVIPTNIEWVFKPLTRAKLHVAFADIVAHQETLVSPNGTVGGGLGGLVGNGKMSIKRRTAQQVVVNQKEIFSQMHDAMEGKNIRILLAEDDLTNQKVIRRYFQMVGAELMIANDGNECLDKFKSHPKGYFSLVLCDLFMPGKDGYEATRAIRQWEDENLDDGEKRIPIVALSANVMANVAEQCLSSGFTSYLSKPVDFKRLSETLRKLVLE